MPRKDKVMLYTYVMPETREQVNRLAKELGYSGFSEFNRALLKSAFDAQGIPWDDEHDPVQQWGEHLRREDDHAG